MRESTLILSTLALILFSGGNESATHKPPERPEKQRQEITAPKPTRPAKPATKPTAKPKTKPAAKPKATYRTVRRYRYVRQRVGPFRWRTVRVPYSARVRVRSSRSRGG